MPGPIHLKKYPGREYECPNRSKQIGMFFASIQHGIQRRRQKADPFRFRVRSVRRKPIENVHQEQTCISVLSS